MSDDLAHPDPLEVIAILTRWVRELQCDLADTRHRNVQLEHQVRGFGFWMRTGRTPAQIRALAADLARVA